MIYFASAVLCIYVSSEFIGGSRLRPSRARAYYNMQPPGIGFSETSPARIELINALACRRGFAAVLVVLVLEFGVIFFCWLRLRSDELFM